MMRMHCRDIAQLLGAQLKSSEEIHRVAIDSRRVEAKTLFFALPGKQSDGHNFLAEVKAKRGVAAVVSKSYRGLSHGLTLIRVSNVQDALHRLSRAVHKKRKGIVIGVTGTVGKTTV